MSSNFDLHTKWDVISLNGGMNVYCIVEPCNVVKYMMNRIVNEMYYLGKKIYLIVKSTKFCEVCKGREKSTYKNDSSIFFQKHTNNFFYTI